MDSSKGAPALSQDFEALLEHIRQGRGLDFTGYKRPSLMRRFNKRLAAVRVNTYTEYRDYLEVHPEEFGILFNTILVNVTSFFRDPEAWDYLAGKVIPAIVSARAPNDTIRVWSAGCASGEEPYSLAILLAEAIGKQACLQRVKIYATDIDEEALAQARSGTYSPQAIQDVPVPLRDGYFQNAGGHAIFDKDLRRAVIFGHHDLMHDAPISKLDLLVCRNTLMYFNSESQRRIVARFHFALNEGGFLFLGRAETLLTTTNLFTPVLAKHRIFSKVATTPVRDRLLIMAQAGARTMRLREAAFESGPMAQVVVEVGGSLAIANQEACAMFSLTTKDLGRPFSELEASYRPVDLRSTIEQTYAERRPLRFNRVERSFPDGSVQHLDIQVVPLFDNGGGPLGVAISFADVTHLTQLELDLQRVAQELETANEELQSANEELETTNEELQSANEELETTNEELQSANEELETTNEELQSANEELVTSNEQLREMTAQLDEASTFFRSVLASLKTGLAVLAQNMQVLHWNEAAEDMWGLREKEVRGMHLMALDTGFAAHDLRERIANVLSGKSLREEAVLPAVNRRGKAFRCRFTATPMTDPRGATQGAVLLMEPPHADEE